MTHLPISITCLLIKLLGEKCRHDIIIFTGEGKSVFNYGRRTVTRRRWSDGGRAQTRGKNTDKEHTDNGDIITRIMMMIITHNTMKVKQQILDTCQEQET